MKTLLVAGFCCWCGILSGHAADGAGTNEVLIADFEADTWGEWQVTGNAFGSGPARGALPNQMAVTGFLGRGLVNSYVGGDRSTGTLTSAEFIITRPYLNFLIGGGNRPGEVCINLLIDDKVERSATGTEFERLTWHTWNLFAVQKKRARIQIVDRHPGGWGHVNIDQIMLSDRPKVPPYFNDAVTRAMVAVAEATPRATNDPTRPIYHFLAPANWMNDPNGPIHHRGYYHIYYQHNPFGDRWGHMHWGHARSRDLVSWKHLPISLWPSKEAGEDHVFSGCTTTNSAGEFLAFYTSIGFGKSATDYAEQWVAIGDSEGNTFKKHEANPVLGEKLHGAVKVYDWRDPFVFRDGGKTFLVCGGNLNRGKGGQGVVLLYEAADGRLMEWTYRGVLFTHPDASVKNLECPNFFKLGDRWVLIVSPHDKVQYFTGTFDPIAGKFTSQQRGLMDHSGDYYAPNCMEDPQGRRILWGWVRGFKEDRGWNGCLTLARVLAMAPDGRLQQTPVPALQQLRGQVFNLSAKEIENGTNFLENLRGDALEIETELDLAGARNFGLLLRASADGGKAVTVSYDGNELSVAGVKTKLSLPATDKTLKLHLFLDRSVLEVYANGEVCVTRVIYPEEQDLGLGLFASGGAAKIKTFQAWPLKTIW